MKMPLIRLRDICKTYSLGEVKVENPGLVSFDLVSIGLVARF